MKSNSKTIGLGLSLLAGALALAPHSAFAQADPTASGGVQKPYIMILMDSSASMEWTDEGDEEYPNRLPNGDESGANEWKPGKEIFPSGESQYGPCYIWETATEAACDDYERPAWTINDEWTEEYGATSGVRASRLAQMQSATGDRLRNYSQPRHVTLKEILTGEMVMFRGASSGSPQDLDPSTHGPGCWFVPRQHDATAQGGFNVCNDELQEFEKLPDYDDPKPHFQEVFDGQRTDGLMDTVAGNAIFALAMFDGYKDDDEDPVKGWKGGKGADHLNDPMRHDFADLDASGKDEGEHDQSTGNYNLGVFQIVSPKKLDMSTSMAGHISTFVQYALIDAGYLTRKDNKLKPEDEDSGTVDTTLAGLLDGDDLKLRLAKDLDKFVDDYHLGKQPIARATPLAAAIYDIHHFFAHGKKGKDNESPVVEDPYKNCRPKHVIMITDGYPEPELQTSGSVDVGGETLTSAFGYEPAKYPYSYTEDAIYRFVQDRKYDSSDTRRVSPGSTNSYLADDWSTTAGARFNPRVHVVGLKVGEPDSENEELEKEAIEKLAAMAMEGKTCAGAYLGDEWMTSYSGGSCDPTDRVCLDDRQARIMASKSYDYVKKDGTTEPCDYPALILTTKRSGTTLNPEQNLVDATSEALSLLFNGILSGGVASRTRPTFVNNLDDPKADAGGQFRFFSGLSIDQAEIFWRGLLYRNSNLCSASDTDAPLAMHEQIDDLAGSVDSSGAPSGDNRRIFTSFVASTAFDYRDDERVPLEQSGTKRDRFLFSMDLEETDAGEFGSGYLAAQPDNLENTRVPFEYDQLSKAIDNVNTNSPYTLALDPVSYFQTDSNSSLLRLINEVRGRSEQKQERAFGAILNSSPRAVEPPQLDLPIDSYRAYKSMYAERPSMLYVATTDGLLHGIYSGELNNNETKDAQVKKRRSGSESDGSMHDQREAWAYIPQMLHNDLSLYQGQQPYLMDGTPVVSDVRLCHSDKDYNQNSQTCCTPGSTNCDQDGFNQWRTVLVSGLGQAGAGYFALDVTRPGGEHPQADGTLDIQLPDPVPLWEFDGNWERGQVERLADINGGDQDELVYPTRSGLRDGSDGDFIDENDELPTVDTDGDGKLDYFWDQSFLGTSVGEAAIGTVALNTALAGDGDTTLRRPVAVFTGGSSGPYGSPEGREERSGRAIYVVDLQTGTLLRRFVSYIDASDVEQRFEFPVSGSPALYDSFPGALVTRGFVGDGAGRLFRIDLSSENPLDWRVELFFDPATDIDWSSWSNPPSQFGPASYKPALAIGTQAVENDLLVYYGLGERGDLSSGGQTQVMIAVQETINVTVSGSQRIADVEGKYVWHAEFQDDNPDSASTSSDYVEKLTGAPVVFNKGVYFTTYVEPAGDRCEPGFSRIYGMKFEGRRDPTDAFTLLGEPEGLFARNSTGASGTEVPLPSGTDGHLGPNADAASNPPYWAYQPENTSNLQTPLVVRGLTVTLGPSCSSNPAETGGSVSTQTRQPTLIAQSSSGMTGSDTDVAENTDTASDKLFSIEQNLQPPASQQIPMSWSVIDN